MARGDVVSDIVSIAASSTYDAQPSGSVEWVIKAWGADSPASTNRLTMYDGTNRARIAQADKAMGVFNGMGELTLPVTNANYLSLQNGHGSVAYPFFYGGYVTDAG